MSGWLYIIDWVRKGVRDATPARRQAGVDRLAPEPPRVRPPSQRSRLGPARQLSRSLPMRRSRPRAREAWFLWRDRRRGHSRRPGQRPALELSGRAAVAGCAGIDVRACDDDCGRNHTCTFRRKVRSRVPHDIVISDRESRMEGLPSLPEAQWVGPCTIGSHGGLLSLAPSVPATPCEPSTFPNLATSN